MEYQAFPSHTYTGTACKGFDVSEMSLSALFVGATKTPHLNSDKPGYF